MKKQILGLSIATAFALPVAAQQSVEVLHWWTSGSEAAALSVLKDNLEKQGVKWNDMPVAGGGGEAAMTAVRARVTSGNPPTAVQMMGFDLSDWAKQGVLSDLNELAMKQGWDKVVPAAVQRFSKFNGKWIAVPVNLHSTNWIWANKEVLTKAGVMTEPMTWDEFIAAAEKVQKAGFIAIAHGGQPWQDATVFDGVALATGGPDYYRKAFVELDPKALNSPTTEKVFERMAQLRRFVDKDFSGRDWNVASGMVISGKAGFQMMGDWAKGEFINAKKIPGKDFLCFRTPGSQGSVSFNTDQFAMFKVGGDKGAAQIKLASAIMDPAFQTAFNVVKGSVPARTDVPDTAFDDCGKKGMKDLAEASKKNTLVGSIGHGHAVPASIKNAFYDVITRHFNGQIDSKKAVAEMLSAAKN
ncbi:ABC transporter substrate-binding protein [Verminephrobacter aporrectodeae]|uniref:Probable sugar-binding periplasmic protein n=1 Tax=Verminephrobacter aporrectodeae subsp. tuberculatae TaxID=1110392 RepID=A0ABT3KPB9_9BURK|nr:ABC transporter substrate-binding protein [Verminephrobacter aporrectodeae]MCW5220908.1 carbohydrate ABC transporter substrate-binding protein [Verminephrobacter aporrectodeae subsp. tuberculatae]MCW5290203.1 carbohydrate ABC transporter substrate-binding protein [Verminephrobacter aporrectodeae subsp. tuberculatae]MCW5320148.1 carbohydrate ABC transporter substrate-binding protein [Verminephrobacter aporrectodeae subsp. tuberculatae]MCW8165412.1 carbohydrate ABC transporter substrate-bindin